MKIKTYRGWIIFVLFCAACYAISGKASFPTESEVLVAYLQAFPEVKSIGIIYSQPDMEDTIQKLTESAETKKVNVIKIRAPSIKEFPQALRDMKDKVDTFWVLDDPLYSMKEAWTYFIMFSLRNGIKTVVFSEKVLADGGLFFYTEKKEIMVNKRILDVNGFKVSEKAGPVKYFGESSQESN